jgi:hypothetical protein
MIVWPSLSDSTTGGGAVGNNLYTRLGNVNTISGTGQGNVATGNVQYQNYTTGSPGAVNSVDSTKGSPAVRFFNGAAGDKASMKFNQGVGTLEVEQLAPGIQPDRLFRVFRFVMRAAFPALGGAINRTTCDIGMCLLPGNVADMNNGANRPGIQLGPVDNGIFALRSRKSFAGAYDFSQDFTYAQLGFPASPAETWCTYELRVISADNTGNAKVKAFVNEIQVGPTLTISAADGRAPGPAASGGGFNGLIPQVINSNSGAYSWYMKYCALIWTPDEQGNL